MSITLTVTGNKSILESKFQPPVNLWDKCECGLIFFSAFNSIPNINNSNNVFAYGENGNQLKIPHGTYDLFDLTNYLQNKLVDCQLKIEPNSNNMKCSIYCSKTINFNVNNSIGQLIGFKKRKLEANKWHESEEPVNILPLAVIRIECDLVQGSFINGIAEHIIYEFVPNVASGHRYIEVPKNIIYLPVNKSSLTSVTVKIVDEFGNPVDFNGETIQLRLHLRRTT